MSTKTERKWKLVVHLEKSKFFIFSLTVPYGGMRKVIGFFSRNIFLNLHKIKKAVTSQNVLKGIRKIRDWYLPIEFASWKEPFRAFNIAVEVFASNLTSILRQWIKFRGHGKPMKLTKIHLRIICNLACFFKRHFLYPVKHRRTWNWHS